MALPRQGTGFTNIQNVLKANQGANLGQNIGGKISNVVGGVKKGTEEEQSKFQTGLKQNELGTQDDITKRQSVLNKVSGLNKYDEIGNVNDEDAKSFERFRSGQYAGPTQLGNIGQLTNQAQEAVQVGAATKTQPGRFGLLRRFLGPQSNNYNQGQQKLDSLLLGTDQSNALKQARRETIQVKDVPTAANTAARAQAGIALTQAGKFGEETRGELGSREGVLNTDINAQYSKAQSDEANRQRAFNELRGRLAAGEAGVVGGAGFDDAGSDLSNLTAGGADFNRYLSGRLVGGSRELGDRGQTSTEAQRAQFDALGRLSGKQSEFDKFKQGTNTASKFNIGDDAYGILEKSLQAKTGYNPEQYKSIADSLPGREADVHNRIKGYIRSVLQRQAQSAGTNGVLTGDPYHFGGVQLAAGRNPDEQAHNTASDIISGKIGGGDPFGQGRDNDDQGLMSHLLGLKNERAKFASTTAQRNQFASERQRLSEIMNKYRS